MTITDFFISEDASIVDALERIDKTGKKCVFVLDEEGRLVASLADGDIRRFILRKGTSKGKVRDAGNYKPLFVKLGDEDRALSILRKKRLTLVPVVDEDMHPVNLIGEGSVNNHSRGILSTPVPVVMMAGGKGSRLMPITAVLPKPLVPIKEKPIAEHIIDRFCEAGCDNFFLIVNYKKKMIKAYFDEIDRDYDITYLEETDYLGTGGGLKLAEPYLDTEFIFTNCDVLVDVDWQSLHDVHKRSGNSITVVSSLKHFTIPYGTIDIAEGGHIESMTEKPKISSLVNTGCYLVERDVLDMIEENEEIGFPDIIDRCLKKGRNVGVFPISEGSWLDMGQFDELHHMIDVLESENAI